MDNCSILFLFCFDWSIIVGTKKKTDKNSLRLSKRHYERICSAQVSSQLPHVFLLGNWTDTRFLQCYYSALNVVATEQLVSAVWFYMQLSTKKESLLQKVVSYRSGEACQQFIEYLSVQSFTDVTPLSKTVQLIQKVSVFCAHFPRICQCEDSPCLVTYYGVIDTPELQKRLKVSWVCRQTLEEMAGISLKGRNCVWCDMEMMVIVFNLFFLLIWNSRFFKSRPKSLLSLVSEHYLIISADKQDYKFCPRCPAHNYSTQINNTFDTIYEYEK